MDAEKKLKEKRKLFVQSVSEDTLRNLLDYLLSEKVLNQEEVEILKKKNYTTMDKARDLMDFIYVIKEKRERTCLALIICNIEFEHLSRRNGAEHNIIGLKGLLEDLGYSVNVEKNLTATEVESKLVAFAARSEHKSSDSTFLVFMSHGLLHKLVGIKHSDNKPDVLFYDTIFQIFNNPKRTHLRDKPKVITIQACRGELCREAWVNDSPASSSNSSSQSPKNLQNDGVHKTHVEKDFVAFCSSPPRMCLSFAGKDLWE
ncbi:caspase-1-like [Dugong dugon]